MPHVRHQVKAGAQVGSPVSDRYLSEQRYDHWVRAVLGCHAGPELLRAGQNGYNLALRQRDYKTDTLRFLCAARVPFTTNQAE